MRTILVIEDDDAIRQGIVDTLEYHGYCVRQVADGDLGLKKATNSDYDLLLLDLALPGKTGLEILQGVRRLRPAQPVIILTAKGSETDRVNGLKAGADDYVVKPFSIKELVARVEAVLRRSPARPSDLTKINFPNGVIDFERRELRLMTMNGRS